MVYTRVGINLHISSRLVDPNGGVESYARIH